MKKGKTTVLGMVILFAAAVAGVQFALPGYQLKALNSVLFGWLLFLPDVVPRMTYDLPSLVLGPVAFLLFGAGLHLFIRKLTGACRSADNASSRRWKIRSSAAVVGLTIVAFAAGTSMVAIVHQVVWLTTSSDRWTEVELRTDVTQRVVPLKRTWDAD
ncbi:MAG: hypothetical protein AB7O26_18795 [Planctomycetaceae bacterium]